MHYWQVVLSLPPPSEKLLLYDDVDDEVLRSFHEMSLANLIFYAMKEGACSEQSSRMTAMDAASKNAGELDELGGCDDAQCLEIREFLLKNISGNVC